MFFTEGTLCKVRRSVLWRYVCLREKKWFHVIHNTCEASGWNAASDIQLRLFCHKLVLRRPWYVLTWEDLVNLIQDVSSFISCFNSSSCSHDNILERIFHKLTTSYWQIVDASMHKFNNINFATHSILISSIGPLSLQRKKNVKHLFVIAVSYLRILIDGILVRLAILHHTFNFLFKL